jgi:hypothetical protein
VADLLDIAPQQEQVETVEVMGQPVEIRPLAMKQLAGLLRRFPDMRKSFFRKDAPEDIQGAAMLEAWPAIIAAGVGHAGEADYEGAAGRLPIPEQLKLGGAVMRLSFPKTEEEEGPLPDSAAVIAGAVAEEESTSSPPPSSG